MDNSYIGKMIDNRYDIISLIGVGGMSNVYKAIDTATGNTVAVKFLKHEFFENEELVRRFKNESKAISLLDNPNIIRVVDVNITDTEKYIVVEYIDGITLKEYIDNRKVLTWQETVQFTGTILSAIGHAHENGIIHRDMKPQNIMLLRDGTLKIMDFGIARLSTANQKTVTDKAIGSVHYISPEQVRGKASDGRSDIYSIGIMMYEMLTGTLPFVSDTAVSVAMKQVQDTARKPSEIVDTIPQGLEQIVMKAIEKNPNDRYQTAAEMYQDLHAFRNNPAIIFPYGLETEKTQAVTVKKETEKKVKPKKSKVKKQFGLTLPVMAGISAAFAVSCLIAIFFIFKLSGNPLLTTYDDVDLPNFVGMTEQELKATSTSLNFDIEYVHSSEYPEGVIFSQVPKPPKTIKENGTVKIKVSKGALSSQLPDLTNYSRNDAEAILSDMEVNVDIQTVSDKNIGMGYVVKTEPGRGTIVTSGSTVTLYISRGDGDASKKKTNVPNVIGLTTLEEAKKVLANNDLRVGSYTYRPDWTPAGTVLDQNPVEGTELVVGGSVDLMISQGTYCSICQATDHMDDGHPRCPVCGDPWHTVHPTPTPTPTPKPTPPPPEHYHGNGTDSGTCPNCGLRYAPAPTPEPEHYHGNGTDSGTCPNCGLQYAPAPAPEAPVTPETPPADTPADTTVNTPAE